MDDCVAVVVDGVAGDSCVTVRADGCKVVVVEAEDESAAVLVVLDGGFVDCCVAVVPV